MRIKYTFGILFVQSFLPRCRGKFYTKISFFIKKVSKSYLLFTKAHIRVVGLKKSVLWSMDFWKDVFFALLNSRELCGKAVGKYFLLIGYVRWIV